MAVPPKISFRLTPELQAALEVRVGQGQAVSDVIREALEQYLDLRPTASPTASPTVPQVSDILSDALSDVSARVAALTTALIDIEARLERLEARETPNQRGVGQRRTVRPTDSPTPRLTTSPTDQLATDIPAMTTPKQCRYGHPVYDQAHHAVCPQCHRERQARYRERKAQGR
jgi:Arc/MetJ-type ribon-helix-helix transcriptional regulator